MGTANGQSLPYHVIDTDDILFVAILVVDDHCGADLNPRVAARLVEEAEVRTHHLALLDH